MTDGCDVIGLDEAQAEKYARLREAMRAMGRVVVAFSAGVDSTVVLKVALDVLGKENVLAATGVSPSLARRELESVKKLAAVLDAPLKLIETREMENPSYAANPSNRCYFCKTELYGKLSAVVGEFHGEGSGFGVQGSGGGGRWVIVNGVNADDVGDWRPGLKAAAEWDVRAPLLEVGLNKSDVRAVARHLGLPNWEKPALACLSSRVPYGTPVTIRSLSQIEKAEAFLHERGFGGFRVRHHEKLARIEVGVGDMKRLMEQGLREEVVSYFKSIGYTYVTVDLQGFRSGSGNEMLGPVERG